MNELFCGDDLIEIDLYYKVTKNKAGIVHVKILEEDEFEALSTEEKKNISVLKTKWIQQGWEATSGMFKKAMVYNHQKEEETLDWYLFRQIKLKTCLTDWDAKDNNGEPIPCNEFTMNKLHANVAVALMDKYDKLTAIDEAEQEKN